MTEAKRPSPQRWVRTAFAAARKDLTVELRSRGNLLTAFLFAVVVIILFQVLLEPGPALREAAPAALWSAFLFAGLLQLSAAFSRERRDGCLQALALAPAEASALFFGKWLAALAVLGTLQAAVLPVFVAFTGLGCPGGWPLLFLSLVVTDAGFLAVGILCAAMTAGRSGLDVLLAVLVFPLLVPLVLAGGRCVEAVLRGPAGNAYWGAVKLAGGFDLVFLAVAAALFGHVLETADN